MPPALQSMVDATGAGDALAGVTIAAMMHGKPLRAALREGIAAAVLTIASPKAVADDLGARTCRSAGPCAGAASGGMRSAP